MTTPQGMDSGQLRSLWPRLGGAPPRGYILSMDGFIATLLIVAMLATLGVLLIGLFSMARGGEFNRRNSNRFMRWRVILQGTAILLFLLLVLVMRS